MSPSPPPIPSRDAEHLRLLEIFHYVIAGLTALCACIPIIHLALGLFMIFNPDAMSGGPGEKSEPPPPFVGFLFAGLGLLFILLGWTAALLTLYSGRMLAKRRRRTFSIVIAALLCAFAPLGTILGIFTIILLTKDSVIRLYEDSPAA